MEKWNIIVQGFDPKQVTKHEKAFQSRQWCEKPSQF